MLLEERNDDKPDANQVWHWMDLEAITILQSVNKCDGDTLLTRKGAVDNTLQHWLERKKGKDVYCESVLRS